MALETSQERWFKRFVRGLKNVYINQSSIVDAEIGSSGLIFAQYKSIKLLLLLQPTTSERFLSSLITLQTFLSKFKEKKIQTNCSLSCVVQLLKIYIMYLSIYLSNDYFEFRVNISMFLDCTHARLNHSNPRNKFIFRLNSVPRSSIILPKD